MTVIITSILAWLAAYPLATTVIFVAGVALITWFIHAYWTWILIGLLLWAIPHILSIIKQMRDIVIPPSESRMTDKLISWMNRKEERQDENSLMTGFRWFKEKVRRMGSTFTKKDAHTWTKKHERLDDLGNDQGALTTREENVRWDDIPSGIRDAITKNQLGSFTVNDFEVFDNRVKERAQEEQMPQLMAMVT